MGDLFKNLCKGPVVVVDDLIGTEDPINKLIQEIKENNLPVLTYKSIEEARNNLQGLLFSNFIILDWRMIGGLPSDVQPGEEAIAEDEEKNIEFIKGLRNYCLSPIFVLSSYNIEEITDKLKSEGILTEKKNFVFVENKNILEKTKGSLVSKIEEWIEKSPHIYLTKYLINEWLSKSTAVFWDLYELNSDWPALFYSSFKKEGDPILALRDVFFQLIFSEVDISSIDESLLDTTIEENNIESLKELYKRLVYTTKNINSDIRPGDIFKKDGSYYLNIRPECDTTKRADPPLEIYLLEGKVKTPAQVKNRYDENSARIIDRVTEIIMLFLDGNDIVVFNKKKLLIKNYSEMEGYKICRVSAPKITEIRQSYSSFLGRFGVPSYPKEIVASLFPDTQ